VFADENSLGEVLWSLTDHQETVRDVAKYNVGTNTTSIVNHRQYDSFGRITSETNPGGGNPAAFLYAYTGREWDADAGLFYYRMRWYDPNVGRFISEDPIGFVAGDTNVQRYVGNSTPNLIDSSGLWAGRLGKGGSGWGWPFQTINVKFPVDDELKELIKKADKIAQQKYLNSPIEGPWPMCFDYQRELLERLPKTTEHYELLNCGEHTPGDTGILIRPKEIGDGQWYYLHVVAGDICGGWIQTLIYYEVKLEKTSLDRLLQNGWDEDSAHKEWKAWIEKYKKEKDRKESTRP
jgi:RHS repeat-associated protein